MSDLPERSTASDKNSRLVEMATDQKMITSNWRESFLFPVLDECFRTAQLPFFLTLVLPVVMFIQTMGATLWLGSKSVWPFGSADALEGLFWFCDLGIHTGTLSDHWAVVVVLYLVVIGSVVFMVTVYISYRGKKIFARWQIYLMVIIMLNVFPLMLTPLSAVVGVAIADVDASRSVVNITILVVTLVTWIIIFVLTTWCFDLMASSACLQRAQFAMWDSHLFTLMIMRMSFMVNSGMWIEILPKWMTPLFVFLGVGMLLNEIYWLYFMPILIPYMNSVCMGFSLYGFGNGMFAVCSSLIDFEFVSYVYMSLIYGVVGVVGSAFWFRHRRKKIIAQLSAIPVVPEDEDGLLDQVMSLDAHFDTFTLPSSHAAIMYLMVGVSEACPFIVDFSFVQWMLRTYNDKGVIFACLRTIALFPSEQNMLTAVLKAIGSDIMIFTESEEFQLYQIKKINAGRRNGAVYIEDEGFTVLRKRSEEFISTIRGFWLEIHRSKTRITFAALRSLRKETLNMDSMLFDAIEQCPVSQVLNNIYTTFMIEAAANYIGAARYAKKAQLMNQGRHTITDYAFKSLVTVFPKYLYDHILDTKGGIVHKEFYDVHGDDSMSDTSSSSLDNGGIEMHYDDVVSGLISDGKRRVMIQGYMKNMKFRPIMLITLVSIIQMIVTIIIAIGVVTVIPSFRNQSMVTVRANCNLAKICAEMQYISFVLALQLVIEKGHFGGPAEIIETLQLRDEHIIQEASIMSQPYVAVRNVAESLIKFLDEELQLVMSTTDLLSGERSHLFAHIHEVQMFAFSDNVADQYWCNITVSIRAAIILMKTLADKMMTKGVDCEECVQQVFRMEAIIASRFVEIHNSLSNESLDLPRRSIVVKQTIIAVAVLMVICFFGGRCLCFYDIMQGITACSKVLLRVKETTINKSLMRICRTSQDKEVFVTAARSASMTSVIERLSPIIVGLSTFLTIGLLVGAGLLYTDHIDTVRDLIELTCFSAVRLFAGMEKVAATFVTVDELQVVIPDDTTDWFTVIGFGKLLSLYGIDLGTRFAEFYYTGPECDPDLDHYAQFIKCTCANNHIDIFMQYCEVLEYLIPTKGIEVFHDPMFSVVLYLLDTGVFEQLVLISDELEQAIVVDDYDEVHSSAMFMSMLTIVIAIVSEIIELAMWSQVALGFDGFKQLLLLLPPEDLTNEQAIVDYVTGDMDESAQTGSEAILDASVYAVVSFDSNRMVQDASYGLTRLTGFSPDQAIGQPLGWLIPEAGHEQVAFFDRLSSVVTERTDAAAPMVIDCLTASGELVTVSASIVMKFDGETDAAQFSVLLRDLSSEVHQKQALMQVKERTENLVRCLIPGPLYAQLGLCDSPVYNVAHAIVLYIEIVGIADCVHTMAAVELMMLAETVFETFDLRKVQYPAIHTIRRWNGVYSAVCGLFGDLDEPKDQLLQVVHFCLDAQQAINDVNVRLSTDIHLKFGINGGGPVCGSCLSCHNPLFEIIGDITVLACHMQEGGRVDRVQIPASMTKMLPEGEFVFEEADDRFQDQHGQPQSVVFVSNGRSEQLV